MKRDVGVLLVHGIGQQPEGDTLLAFGEPLVRWTDRWLHRTTTGGATGVFEVINSRLTPSKTGDAFPPHATARLLVKENGQERDSTWLMAESWWGGDVQAPPFGRFAGWMLTIGAWTVVAHMTKWARRYENKAARLVVEILATGAGLLLAILLQIAVLVLSILALLPIPALRRGLSSVLLALTGVVGDCYVLVESDLQRAAIVTRTRAALEWLAQLSEGSRYRPLARRGGRPLCAAFGNSGERRAARHIWIGPRQARRAGALQQNGRARALGGADGATSSSASGARRVHHALRAARRPVRDGALLRGVPGFRLGCPGVLHGAGALGARR